MFLADHVDLILCFFDPIGQALCKRTENNRTQRAPRREAGVLHEQGRPGGEGARQAGADPDHPEPGGSHQKLYAKLPIYLPRDDLAVPIPNALEVCDDIDKAIRLTVQKNLTTMQDDCDAIVAEIANARAQRRTRRITRAHGEGWALMVFGWVVLATLFYVAVLEACATKPVTTALRTPRSRRWRRSRCSEIWSRVCCRTGGGGGSAWNTAARWRWASSQ